MKNRENSKFSKKINKIVVQIYWTHVRPWCDVEKGNQKGWQSKQKPTDVSVINNLLLRSYFFIKLAMQTKKTSCIPRYHWTDNTRTYIPLQMPNI